jgi:branched-chain amino acid transport system permease protein
LSELLRGWLSQSVSGLHLVIYGFVVMIVILYFPSGISGAIARAWPARRRDSGVEKEAI